jgi:hypothetical protein
MPVPSQGIKITIWWDLWLIICLFNIYMYIVWQIVQYGLKEKPWIMVITKLPNSEQSWSHTYGQFSLSQPITLSTSSLYTALQIQMTNWSCTLLQELIWWFCLRSCLLLPGTMSTFSIRNQVMWLCCLDYRGLLCWENHVWWNLLDL